ASLGAGPRRQPPGNPAAPRRRAASRTGRACRIPPGGKARSRLRLDPAQILVIPVGEDLLVLDYVRPAVVFAFANDQLGGRAHGVAAFDESLGLVNRH